MKRRAYAWTLLQYALLVALVVGGRFPFPSTGSLLSIVGWGAVTGAGTLTLWALWAFRASRLNLTPIVPDGATHVTTGPYRWVRHPMYAAVLLLAAGLTAIDPSWLRMIAAVCLVPALVGKLTVEEALLLRSYPTYAHHTGSTKRLIPGIW
ncbi:MAG: hypothetical protein MUE68_05025 [Bacteroidetes bacterium]|nr:hypothetical protein [Bacteroidota bacterium]